MPWASRRNYGIVTVQCTDWTLNTSLRSDQRTSERMHAQCHLIIIIITQLVTRHKSIATKQRNRRRVPACKLHVFTSACSVDIGQHALLYRNALSSTHCEHAVATWHLGSILFFRRWDNQQFFRVIYFLFRFNIYASIYKVMTPTPGITLTVGL